jgi:DNA invertase Pin-like site-specific DNA recombinase
MFNPTINNLYLNKNAVIYCRVSTQKQVDDGESLSHQESICRNWCEKHNINIIKTTKGEYSFRDEGISGGKADVDEENSKIQKFINASDPICKKIPGIHHRQGLIDALKACKKGYIFVTYALTRLSRNATQSLVISEYLESKKIHLVCIQDNIEINGENKEEQSVKIHLQSLFSHMEHNAIKKRTKASLQYLKEQGRYLGRIRYGYKLENGKRYDDLVEVPEEQKVIQLMKEMRQNVKNRFGRPASYKDIAKFLNQEGHRTRNGNPWCHSQVEALCTLPPPNLKGNPKKRAKQGTAKPEDIKELENIDSPRIHLQFQQLVKEELGGELESPKTPEIKELPLLQPTEKEQAKEQPVNVNEQKSIDKKEDREVTKKDKKDKKSKKKVQDSSSSDDDDEYEEFLKYKRMMKKIKRKKKQQKKKDSSSESSDESEGSTS